MRVSIFQCETHVEERLICRLILLMNLYLCCLSFSNPELHSQKGNGSSAAILKGLLKEIAYKLHFKSRRSDHCSLAGIIAATKEPKISQVRAEALSALNAIALIYKVDTLSKLLFLHFFLDRPALQLWVVIPCKSLLLCTTRKHCQSQLSWVSLSAMLLKRNL